MTHSEHDRMERLILSVMDRMNAFLPPAERIPSEPGTVLLGEGGRLDSLGIANFIVSVEEALEQELGRSVPLSDQDLNELFGPNTVTVRSFSVYLTEHLQA